VRVFDFVLLLVIAGIIKISPQVITASRIHSAQPKHPRRSVLVTVTGWIRMLLLLHLGHTSLLCCGTKAPQQLQVIENAGICAPHFGQNMAYSPVTSTKNFALMPS